MSRYRSNNQIAIQQQQLQQSRISDSLKLPTNSLQSDNLIRSNTNSQNDSLKSDNLMRPNNNRSSIKSDDSSDSNQRIPPDPNRSIIKSDYSSDSNSQGSDNIGQPNPNISNNSPNSSLGSNNIYVEPYDEDTGDFIVNDMNKSQQYEDDQFDEQLTQQEKIDKYMSINDFDFEYNDPGDDFDYNPINNFDRSNPVSKSDSDFGNSEEFKFNFTNDQNKPRPSTSQQKSDTNVNWYSNSDESEFGLSKSSYSGKPQQPSDNRYQGSDFWSQSSSLPDKLNEFNKNKERLMKDLKGDSNPNSNDSQRVFPYQEPVVNEYGNNIEEESKYYKSRDNDDYDYDYGRPEDFKLDLLNSNDMEVRDQDSYSSSSEGSRDTQQKQNSNRAAQVPLRRSSQMVNSVRPIGAPQRQQVYTKSQQQDRDLEELQSYMNQMKIGNQTQSDFNKSGQSFNQRSLDTDQQKDMELDQLSQYRNQLLKEAQYKSSLNSNQSNDPLYKKEIEHNEKDFQDSLGNKINVQRKPNMFLKPKVKQQPDQQIQLGQNSIPVDPLIQAKDMYDSLGNKIKVQRRPNMFQNPKFDFYPAQKKNVGNLDSNTDPQPVKEPKQSIFSKVKNLFF